MCGIFGIVNGQGYVNNKVCEFIRDGFIASGVRGLDSSGVFQLDKKHKPFNHKRALAGHDFIANKMTQSFIRDADTSLLTLCHVRAATQGKVSEDNAHPFAVERDDGTYVIGMHNGTLTNWSYKEDAKLFDVDSEWAIHMIAKHGVDAFKLFTGAYAMMWWDQSKKDKLFIARNKERPLHFRLSDDKKIMYIASEAGMLAWLTERNELKTQKEIYTFEVGKLYTFNVNLGEITWTKEDLPAVAGTVASPQTAAGKESSQQNSTTAKGSSVNETDDVGFEGERFLDGIKMAASRARGFLYADANKSNLPSSSELSKAVDKAVTSITSSAADDGAIPLSEAFDDEDVPFSEVSDSSSREAGFDWIAEDSWYTLVGTGNREVELAKQMNVFAEVHWLEGVDFDEDRKELLGEVKDYLPGKGHVVYPTIVRGLTGGEAYHYIENMKNGKCGDYIVITGMYDDKMMGRTLIGTPLSKEGMAYINRKVN